MRTTTCGRSRPWRRSPSSGRATIEPRNPWAQHALTHVLIRQGRVKEGLAHMEAFLPLLATCGRPIHSHDAWHLALLHLEHLDVAAAMGVFHSHIWGITPDFVVEQLDHEIRGDAPDVRMKDAHRGGDIEVLEVQ